LGLYVISSVVMNAYLSGSACPDFFKLSEFLRSVIMRNHDWSGWGVCLLPHQMRNTVQDYWEFWTKREWQSLYLNGGITEHISLTIK